MKFKTLLRKPRFAFVYVLAIWLIFVAHTTEAAFRAGACIALLGEAIRLWANGYVGHKKVNWTQKERHDPKIGQLITGGPYAFVRHPLYFGTFLIGAGVCVIVGNVWMALAALTGFLLIYRRKMAEEEVTLREEWGETFARYEQAVPRWLPTGRRFQYRHGEWSWQGILASKEPKTVVWVLVVLIALYFREEAWQEGTLFAAGERTKHIALMVLAALLIMADGIFELIVRRAARRAKSA